MTERDVRTMLRDLGDGVAPSPDLPQRAERTYRRREARRRVATGAIAVVGVALVAVVGAFALRGDNDTDRRIRTVTTPPAPVIGPEVSPDLLENLSFVDDHHGFATVGLNASLPDERLAATTDGGRTWHIQGSPIPGVWGGSDSLTRVVFTSLRDGLAFGVDEWATHDAGTTWTRVLQPQSPFTEVEGEGPSMWAIFGCDTCEWGVERSTDGGATWQATASQPIVPSGRQLMSLEVLDDGTAFALIPNDPSGPGQLVATHDGGAHWTVTDAPCRDMGVCSLSAADAQHLWLACGGEPATIMQPKEILRSADGGRTWRLVAGVYPPGRDPVGEVPITGDVTDLVALDHQHAWMNLGRGGLAVTRDGGRTWTDAGLPGFEAAADVLGQVTASDATHAWAWASGQGGAFWRTTDGVHWEKLGG